MVNSNRANAVRLAKANKRMADWSAASDNPEALSRFFQKLVSELIEFEKGQTRELSAKGGYIAEGQFTPTDPAKFAAFLDGNAKNIALGDSIIAELEPGTAKSLDATYLTLMKFAEHAIATQKLTPANIEPKLFNEAECAEMLAQGIKSFIPGAINDDVAKVGLKPYIYKFAFSQRGIAEEYQSSLPEYKAVLKTARELQELCAPNSSMDARNLLPAVLVLRESYPNSPYGKWAANIAAELSKHIQLQDKGAAPVAEGVFQEPKKGISDPALLR